MSDSLMFRGCAASTVVFSTGHGLNAPSFLFKIRFKANLQPCSPFLLTPNALVVYGEVLVFTNIHTCKWSQGLFLDHGVLEWPFKRK